MNKQAVMHCLLEVDLICEYGKQKIQKANADPYHEHKERTGIRRFQHCNHNQCSHPRSDKCIY